jgi:putative DNA methylase
MTLPRLIEVALPIREISAESVRDKSLRHGHISTLHLWWARRPLAASRAIVFASIVPDPDHPDCPAEFRQAVLKYLRDDVPAELKAYRRGRDLKRDPDPYKPYADIPDTARNRLLTFIAKWSPEWQSFEKGLAKKQPPPAEMLDDRSLVKWDTSDPRNEQGRAVLAIARELALVANGGKIPTLLDPFSGGGAIPLEATRLGFQAFANDYNPVAYLILRATCEFPQKFGKPGKRTMEREEYGQIKREEINVDNVLAYDVEYWAKWILERVRQRIGHLYPSGKDGLPVVGYLWARTVPCSNPSCQAEIPLLRTLMVCDKAEKRIALTLKVEGKKTFFGIAKNAAIQRKEGTTIGGGDCRCPICEQVTPVEDVRRAGLNGKLGECMTAVIVDLPNGKDYRSPEQTDLIAFQEAQNLARTLEHPSEYIVPEINAPSASPNAGSHRSISVDIYGYKTFGTLYNDRQLVSMQTLTACLVEAELELKKYYDGDYTDAVIGYLGLWVSRNSMRFTNMGRFDSGGETFQSPFASQSIAMVWDYAEPSPFNETTGGCLSQLDWMLRVIHHETPNFETVHLAPAKVSIGDGSHLKLENSIIDVVVTDPPYFDSIAYADLSDFFYIWLKRGLSNTFPIAFNTPQTPKSQEAVAHKHRHEGNRDKGKEHFQAKLAEVFLEAKRICKTNGVVAVMFAHQSTEAWTALINALLNAGLTVTATYPIDTELKNRAVALGVAALESSITVVCRPREISSATSFRDVRREVEQSVAESVHRFWDYGFRGADLIVACYGPAVGVFGRYSRVERADGTPVTVPELLDLARQSALKAIAGEFTGDPLSRLYFVWANLYGISEQSWDDARLVIQIGGESENAMEVARERSLFVVDGATCRLALLKDRINHKHLGDESAAPLIDQLHHAMQLWKEEKRGDLVTYLRANALLDHVPYWKLAQALFEVMPRDEEDWKLIASLLGERETLRLEAKRSEQPKQQSMFDS